MFDFRLKILKIASLKKSLSALKRKGKVIAFTNGCFDILHRGHVSYLAAAKKDLSRVLVVGINSDISVRLLEKGPERPIVPQAERAAVLAGLESVDFVIIFDEATPYELIKKVQPDILLKGADWKGREVAGADIVKAYGGRVEFVKYINNLSSTHVIEKIKMLCQKQS
jgi:D-beta-D-heptose 7-phosphate kinase/D-beta-D-heptose 1-phosphate adenosyltransferase